MSAEYARAPKTFSPLVSLSRSFFSPPFSTYVPHHPPAFLRRPPRSLALRVDRSPPCARDEPRATTRFRQKRSLVSQHLSRGTRSVSSRVTRLSIRACGDSSFFEERTPSRGESDECVGVPPPSVSCLLFASRVTHRDNEYDIVRSPVRSRVRALLFMNR